MQSWGAGLTAGFNSNLDIVNNTFAYNGGDDGTTRYGGGIYALPGSNVWISNSIFYRNSARNEGSAIYCEPGASVTLVCSDVYGNSGGDWVGCIADQDGINGNFCEDPLFCDPTSGDFTLDRSSSCLPGNHPSGEDCGLIGALEQACGAIVGSLDIKPGSCPNPFNIKWLENTDKENGIKYAALKKGGVLPVAIAGSENFDVTEVDVSTLFLEGVAPLRSSLEDVTRPADGGEECACATGGPDGHMDLNLKFSRREIAVVIGPAEHREVVILSITGSMVDGTSFEASDCVTVLGRRPDLPMPEYSDQAQLGPALPNPFNPVTRFVYWLPRSEFVKLSIFDVAGRLV
ncbi:MAG: hypothetical protein KAT30_00595, partial [Candidatus Krumholzibacteria bacterium]|nr:hypothetical protein [Candidatus Krumholzibacteria bacterium]